MGFEWSKKFWISFVGKTLIITHCKMHCNVWIWGSQAMSVEAREESQFPQHMLVRIIAHYHWNQQKGNGLFQPVQCFFFLPHLSSSLQYSLCGSLWSLIIPHCSQRATHANPHINFFSPPCSLSCTRFTPLLCVACYCRLIDQIKEKQQDQLPYVP